MHECKWQIWKNRNNVRYGKKYTEEPETIYIYNKSIFEWKYQCWLNKQSKRDEIDEEEINVMNLFNEL